VKTRPVRKTKDWKLLPVDRHRHERPLRLEGHRVERHEEGPVGQALCGDEPLDECHAGDDEEHRHGGATAEDEREGQGRREPEIGMGCPAFDEPARGQHEQRRRQDEVDERGVAAVEGAQRLPDSPGVLVVPLTRRCGRRVDASAPGPEPLGVQVT
jgi:hypothetical protein